MLILFTVLFFIYLNSFLSKIHQYNLAHFEVLDIGADCGGIFSEMQGIVSSPGYPMPYPNDLECFYYFRGLPENVIQIKFLVFVMEDQSTGRSVTFLFSDPN